MHVLINHKFMALKIFKNVTKNLLEECQCQGTCFQKTTNFSANENYSNCVNSFSFESGIKQLKKTTPLKTHKKLVIGSKIPFDGI